MSSFSCPLFLFGLCSESLSSTKQQILGMLSFLDQAPATLFSSKNENGTAAQLLSTSPPRNQPEYTWVSTQWLCLDPLGEPELTDSGSNQSLFLGPLNLELDRSGANSVVERRDAGSDNGREAVWRCCF